ncbi:hypothetical protein KJ765_01890 [Candidatus Micrarchaeota archaeon]|nr:hypothetical protein [Candidatus Micrarchaeota archaeon]
MSKSVVQLAKQSDYADSALWAVQNHHGNTEGRVQENFAQATRAIARFEHLTPRLLRLIEAHAPGSPVTSQKHFALALRIIHATHPSQRDAAADLYRKLGLAKNARKLGIPAGELKKK